VLTKKTQLNKIDENWNLFEHETKIRTYLKKLDENCDQKGISTYFLNVGHVGQIFKCGTCWTNKFVDSHKSIFHDSQLKSNSGLST